MNYNYECQKFIVVTKFGTKCQVLTTHQGRVFDRYTTSSIIVANSYL